MRAICLYHSSESIFNMIRDTHLSQAKSHYSHVLNKHLVVIQLQNYIILIILETHLSCDRHGGRCSKLKKEGLMDLHYVCAISQYCNYVIFKVIFDTVPFMSAVYTEEERICNRQLFTACRILKYSSSYGTLNFSRNGLRISSFSFQPYHPDF